jgi:AraC-like DNA-binding protein
MAVKKRTCIRISEENKKYLADNYKKMSINEIAKNLGYKERTVQQYFYREFELPLKNNNALITKSNKFFDVDEYAKTIHTI